ncbi:MAG: hypothetical protein OXI71_12310 [Gemmatimonadota bacterium]|nr:hypothetical protein [Gemmatimonadota bacterium]
MASRPVAPALLAPLLGFALGALPSPGAFVRTTAQEVEWKRDLRNPIRAVLDFHYNRPFSADVLESETTIGHIYCLAEKGDICFGGDYEDEDCLRPVPCRNPAQMRQFMDGLERAARRRPGDPYAVAQAVYGLARLGDPDRALEVARVCEGVRWWCDLVLGMAYHRSERPLDAEGHFRMGLLGADPELACRLTDITYLLEGRDEETYEHLPCPGPGRTEFDDRFWWLSDPLLTAPGNDRWSEHLTRRFELLLHERLQDVVEPARWFEPGAIDSIRRYVDEVTRRGFPDSFDHTGRWRSDVASRYSFTPASLVGDGVQALRYELEANRWGEGYTPAEYSPFHSVPGQLARFMDGDSLVLAVSADLKAAPINPLQIRFIATNGPAGSSVGLGLPGGDLTPSFTTRFAAVPLVVAIEALDGYDGVSRLREGVMPLDAGPVMLSDPLLVDPIGGELPASRQEAVDAMLPQPWIASANEVIAYWEVYGLRQGQPMQVAVAMAREGAGVVTRVLRTLAGRSDTPAPVVSWTEEASGPAHPVSLTLDLGALDAGNYDLTIEVTGPDGAAATAIRRFRIGER